MTAPRRIRTLLLLAPALALGACSVPTSGTATKPNDCSTAGLSAASVAPTIRCFFRAMSEIDTDTACSVLSIRMQADVASTRTHDWSGVVGGTDGSTSPVPSCSTVMRQVLGQATAQQLADLREQARAIRISGVLVSGGDARATVSISMHGEHASQQLRLVPQSGSWRLDSNSLFQTG